MKRPAGSGGRSAKKRLAADPLAGKCTCIASALEDSCLPDHVKKMLQAGVGRCLRTYKQDRHEFQNQFLEMVAEALEGVKTLRKGALDGAEARATQCEDTVDDDDHASEWDQ